MAEGDYKVKAIVSADTSQFNDGMKKAQSSLNNISKSIQGVQNLLKTAFSVVGITASVGAVVNFGKKAVSAADEANKRFNILANTIKATGANTWTSVEQLDKMAKAYAQSTDYSVSEVEKMQSVLLGFRNITGETFEQASDAIMDMATVMGMDLTSAVQTVGKALDDPVKGLDSLRRQGFQFTEEQKAELQQLVKNGKQLEAQQIILEELSTTYGGAAKAGQSAFARLQHTMDEFKENIGNKLMPIVEAAMGKLADNMNKITAIINSDEFDKFVAILVNIANKVRTVFEKISGEIKTTFQDIKSSMDSVDFSSLISLLDTLIGVVKKTFDEMKTNIQKVFGVFDELKEKMSGFTEILNVEKITTIINTVIDVFYFLRDEIKSVGDAIRKLLFDNIVKIWNYLKQIFENSNAALQNSESSIQSWGQFFYETFDNVFRIFQDLFGGIKAILTGDWELAWEYAKLAMMRVADNILNLMSTIANAFPNLINGMIDALNKLVVEINKVRDFFGQDPLGLIQNISSVDLSESSGLNAKITQAEKKIEELTGKSADVSIKHLQGISKIAAGTTAAIIEDITDTTDAAINNANERKKIETSTYKGIETDAGHAYQKISDWDLKLLQQELGTLKEYSNKYHNVSLELIEAERQKAHEADTTGAEREKINKYYDKQVELENKRHYKAIFNQVSGISDKISNVFKKMATTVGSIFSSIFNKLVSAISGVFTKLFTDNLDDLLEQLLKFEDSILTFFVETLPNLPAFFESALQSVGVLLESILQVITPERVTEIIMNIMSKITEYAPKIIEMISKTVLQLIEGITKALPGITKTISTIIEEIAKVLPQLIEGITKALPEIIKTMSTIVVEIAKALPQLIQSLITAFIEILKNPKEIADMVMALINGFVEIFKVLMKNIGPLLDALLPVIGTLIVEIVKAIPSILTSMATALGQAVAAIGKHIINLLIDVLNNLLDGLSNAWTWIPGLKGKGLPHIPHLATGTDNARRGLTLVGEAGPELVNFRGGEQVLNNHNTQKALAGMGGNTNEFNVNFYNTKDTSAYALVSEFKQYNRQMAINGII